MPARGRGSAFADAVVACIRQARESQGLTSKALADAAGIEPSTWWRTENGLRPMTVGELGRVCRALGLSVRRTVRRACELEVTSRPSQVTA